MTRFVFALAAATVLAACQDPSSVGTGLFGDDPTSPNTRVVTASTVDTTGLETSTSGIAVEGATQEQARVLVGRVADATFGDAASVAYLDASRPSSVPEDFATATITGVSLLLRRDYTYGDTTANLPVEVRRVTGNWAAAGLPADTTLGTGDLITSATISATDTVATIALPADWVAANGAVFRQTDFDTAFEGFELRVPDSYVPAPGAVAGFDLFSAQSYLRVTTAEDTLTFRYADVYSRVTQAPPLAGPLDRVPLRAASPAAFALTFDVTPVGPLPLARAVLALPVDNSFAESGTFKRPLAQRALVFGVTSDSTRSILSEVLVRNGREPRTYAAAAFTRAIQDLLLGQAAYERFEVVFPTTPVSLDILPLARTGDARPRLILTVVSPTP